MLSKTLLDQLQSPVADERKRAIKAIARTKDPDALPHLTKVMRDDDDTAVSELAGKAIDYIKKNAPTKQEQTFSDAADEDKPLQFNKNGVYTNEESLYSDSFIVSKYDRNQASMELKEAMYNHLNGYEDRAYTALNRAFTLNPKLRSDNYAIGVAKDITGLPANIAVKAVLDYQSPLDTEAYEDAQKNNIVNFFGQLEDEWKIAGVDLLIYSLVSSGAIAIAIGRLQTAITPIYTVSGIAYWPMFFFSIVGLLIQYFFIHVSATMMMGGDGTFLDLVRKLTAFHTVVYTLFIVFSVILFSISPAEQSAFWGALYVVFSIAMLLQTGNLISQAYNLKYLNGCATLAMSWFILFIFMCACLSLFTITMMNAWMAPF